jgi:hypothetical protein
VASTSVGPRLEGLPQDPCCRIRAGESALEFQRDRYRAARAVRRGGVWLSETAPVGNGATV